MNRIVWSLAVLVALLAACESNEPGGIRLHYSWVDSEGNDITPPDLSLLFAWGELKYGAETKSTEAVWMGDDDATLHFSGLPYGVTMTMTITMRVGETGGDTDIIGAGDAPDARADNIAYYCTSQEFSLARGKVTDVNNACVMQKGPALSDDNKPGAPVLTLFYATNDAEVEIAAATEFKTPENLIAIEFTAPNDNFDAVIVANDTGFALGKREYPKPEKVGDIYRIENHDINEGWEKILTGDGSRTVALKLRNAIGFESLAASKTIFLDTTPPVLMVSTNKDILNASDQLIISVNATETLNGGPVVELDGTLLAAPEKMGNSWVYRPALSDGEHTITATATDLVGNTPEDAVEKKYTVDSIAPELDGDPVIDPARVKAEQKYAVTFTTKEDLTGGTVTVTRKEETLDCTNEGNDHTCTGTAPTGDKDTVDPIVITLTDPAGNPASFNAGNLTIDRTAPQPTITTNKEKPYNALDQLIITVSVMEDITDDGPAVTLDDVPLTGATKEGNSWIYTPALTHGDHTIKATATDTVGNTTTTAVTKSYTVDALYPTATVSEPDPGRISGSGHATVTVTGGVGETLAQVKINGNDCAGTGPYTCTFNAPSGSGDTTETLVVSFSDEAGNTSTVTKTVTVDRIAPVLTFKKNKVGIYNKNDIGQILLSVSSTEELSELIINGATQNNPIGLSWDIEPDTSTGSHPVTATAKDKAGNPTAVTLEGSYAVDTTDPAATIGALSATRVKENTAVTFTVVKAGDEDLAWVKVWRSDGELAECIAGSCLYTTRIETEKKDSQETITVQYADEAGNTVTANAGVVYVDRTAPVLTFKKNKAGTYNKTDLGQILLSISSTEELSELIINGATQNNPIGLSWDIEPDTSDGPHPVTATAKDKAGNPTEVTIEDSYAVDATDPAATIGALSATRVQGDTAVTFTVTKAGEEELATLTVFDRDGIPQDCDGGLCSYTTKVGTAGEDTKETITIRYADAAGNTVTANAGTVDVDRTPPSFTFRKSKEGETYNATDQIVLTVTASEELSAVMVNDAAQDTATTSWNIIGENTTGDHAVTASATDRAGNTFSKATIGSYTVDADYPAATHDLPNDLRVKGGVAILFTVTKSGVEDLDSVMVRDSDGVFKECPDGNCAYTTAVGAAGTDTAETVAIRYADAAGNTVTENAATIYVDRTAPRMVSRLVTPPEAQETSLVRVVVAFDEPVTDAVFGGGGLAFTRTDDGSDPQRFAYEYPVEGTETEKSYAITLAVNDAAGNPIADPTIGSFTIDLTTPTIADLLVCHDDATDDPCAADETTFSAVTNYNAMKISFSLTEPADLLKVELGASDITTGNCAAYAGPSYICTTTVTDPAGGASPRMEGDLAKVTTGDDAGNGDFDSKSIVYDFLPPTVTGDATIVLARPVDCPLLSDELSRVTYGTTVKALFSVSEELEDGEPVSVIAEKDPQEFSMGLDASAGYSFAYIRTIPLSGTFPQGDYALAVTLRDTVGNEAEISPTLTAPGIYLDTIAPADPAVAITDTVVYHRVPWGSDGTGGVKSFSITAGTDAVDATTSFVIAYDGDDPATDAQIGVMPVANRTFAEMELNRADRAEVYLAAYDNACNRSDAVRVRDIEWTATMGYKVAGSTMENPNLYKKQKWFADTLAQPGSVEQGEINGLADLELPLSDIEGDGSWAQKKSRAATVPRRGHVAAYDPARGKLVVWGGSTDGGLNSDTWEWDGAQWARMDVSDPEGDGAPQQQELWAPSAMVYDTVRGKVLLFHQMETWEWDGISWAKRAGYGCTGPWCFECTSTTCPLLRYGQAMAYDSARGKAVMYGGNWSSGEDKTWEWDGTSWTKVTPTDPEGDLNPPKIASGHAMAYDAERGVVVLFAAGTGWNETWEWNGASWVKRTGGACTTASCYVCTGTTCPSPRYLHGMAYDPVRKKVVQFGGYYYDGWNQSCNNETWEWDGTVWAQKTPTDPETDGNPSAMREHAMAYDALHGKVVLFGGQILYGDPVNETWEWNGTSWAKKSPQAADADGDPAARDTHAMAYDSDRGKVVLFGGDSTYGSVNDTWEWDGSDWVKRAGDSCATGSCYVCAEATCPLARYQHAMAYDAKRKRTVLFGGYAFSCDGANNACRDTWE